MINYVHPRLTMTTSVTPFPWVPVVWGSSCRYCRRYSRPCGRHDDHVYLIRYPQPNTLGLQR